MLLFNVARILSVCLIFLPLVFLSSGASETKSDDVPVSSASEATQTTTTTTKISTNPSPSSASDGLGEFKNKATHETSSPSSHGSLYANAPNTVLNYYVPTSANHQQQHDQNGPQVALGAEHYQQTTTDQNQLAPSDLALDHSMAHMYSNSNPLAMMSTSQQQQQQLDQQQANQQVLASIYIDQYGNQRLRLPPGAQMATPDSQANQINADSISKTFYSPLQQAGPGQMPTAAMLYHNPPFTEGQRFLGQQQQDYQHQGFNTPRAQGSKEIHRKRPHHHKQQQSNQHQQQADNNGEPKYSAGLTLGLTSSSGNHGNGALSNDQLSSLIDQLKEFNSRQVAAGSKSEGDTLPDIKKDDSLDNDDDDIDIDPSSIDTRHSASESFMREPISRLREQGHGNGGRSKTKQHPSAASGKRPQQSSKVKDKDKSKVDKVSPEDMAKFAKFLMTKEGANMRFQLGLEKETPDDGDLDDDENDALLETKNRQRKAEKKSRASGGGSSTGDQAPNDSNEHMEVAKQMDTLLENLTGTLNLAEKAEEKRKERAKRRRQREKDEDVEMESDDRRARARRNSRIKSKQGSQVKEKDKDDNERKHKEQQKQPKKQQPKQQQDQQQEQEQQAQHDDRTEVPPPPPSSGSLPKRAHHHKKTTAHQENLAKKLIQRELAQDKLESKIQNTVKNLSAGSTESPTEPSSPGNSSGGGETEPVDSSSVVSPADSSDSHSRPKRSKVRRHIDAAEASGGEENGSNYPKEDRTRDRSALIEDLRKIRQDKSRVRSDVSSVIIKEPILRRALNGELSMRTESEPDGKSLRLTSGQGHSMTIKLPEKSDSNQLVTHAVMNDDQNGYGGDGLGNDDTSSPNPSDGTGRHHNEPATSSTRQADKLNHVRLASERPVKDEYPISERVSSRLNLLSNNLDRYFNDGFMGAIESKSKVNGDDETKPGANERQQVDSSNINERAAAKTGSGDEVSRDKDFDVNVGIDGKREMPDKDDDEDYPDNTDEDDDGRQSAKGGAKEELGAGNSGSDTDKSTGTGKLAGRSGAASRRARSGSRPTGGQSSKLARRKGDANVRVDDEPAVPMVQGHQVEGVGLMPPRRRENAQDGGSLKQNLSAGNQHLTFEGGESKILGKMDPVDGEVFDSPIGPDTDSLELAILPAKADKIVESSHESKNVITKYGKKMTPKFYEEPEW